MPNNNFQPEGTVETSAENQEILNDQTPQAEALSPASEYEAIIEHNRKAALQGSNIIEDPDQSALEKIETKRQMIEALDKEKIQKSTPAKDDADEEKPDVKEHARQVYQINDPKQQIEKIIQIAITHDPIHAIKVAQHLDDNYILNEIHDRLVEDQVREELIKRGLLQEI